MLATDLGPSDGTKATDAGARAMRQATLEEVISKSDDTSIDCTTCRRGRAPTRTSSDAARVVPCRGTSVPGWPVLRNLQRLFGLLLRGERKYADPTPVIESLRHGDGRRVAIGSQEDVSGTGCRHRGPSRPGRRLTPQWRVQRFQDVRGIARVQPSVLCQLGKGAAAPGQPWQGNWQGDNTVQRDRRSETVRKASPPLHDVAADKGLSRACAQARLPHPGRSTAS